VPVLGKALGEPGRARLLASTAVEYWDASERDDGLLPRPEHHSRPIHELLPLLPFIARAQRQRDENGGEIADACLVCVWDRETLTNCTCFETFRGELPGNIPAYMSHVRMHHELVGVLLDRDPRPMTKDGFSGLVYGYADDADLVAAIGSLCAAKPL
jgi:hypothetical protein